jgi:elongation factor 1-beta
MGMAVVKLKIMPSSPEEDLKSIETEITSLLTKEGVQKPQFEIQPIAFGLKALIVMFGWPEEKPLEDLEESIQKIKGINSVQILDMRRAIG